MPVVASRRLELYMKSVAKDACDNNQRNPPSNPSSPSQILLRLGCRSGSQSINDPTHRSTDATTIQKLISGFVDYVCMMFHLFADFVQIRKGQNSSVCHLKWCNVLITAVPCSKPNPGSSLLFHPKELTAQCQFLSHTLQVVCSCNLKAMNIDNHQTIFLLGENRRTLSKLVTAMNRIGRADSVQIILSHIWM